MEKIVGLEYEKNLINKWLSVFVDPKNIYPEFKNAIFISGPSGVGKTFLTKSLLELNKFDIFEYTVLEVRSEKTIQTQLNDLMNRKSVLQIINPKWKSCIILDELEAMDYRERSSTTIIKKFIEFTPEKKSKDKSKETYKINHVPLILISSNVDKWMKPLIRDCIYIEISPPTALNISLYWSIYFPQIKIPLEYLPQLTDLSSSDYRKAEQIADWLLMYNTRGGLSSSNIEKVIMAMSKKEIDISNISALEGILLNPKDREERIILGSTDYTYLPWILMENFPKTIKTYYMMSDSDIFDTLKEFYLKFIDGQKLNNGLFGNWDLLDVISTYWGIMPYSVLENLTEKTYFKKPKFEIEVSSVNSRYSFKNTNHKAMIPLIKKLDISYENFHIVSNQYLEILEKNDTMNIRKLVNKHIEIGWEINDLERMMKLNINIELDEKLFLKIKPGLSQYQKIWKTITGDK